MRLFKFAVLGLLATPVVQGQESETQIKSNERVKPKAEKIKILGSRIKKMDIEGPKSIIVMDAEAIQRTGATSINEALNTLTISSFGSAEFGSNYGSGDGIQSLSVHGLGSSNTLVLLNGKRLAKDPYLEIIDMSVIPIAAVEKVEILTGTASALYGSDALGGVVNIITKKDFVGFGHGGGYSMARMGGGDVSDLFAVAGTTSSRFQNLTVLNWKHRESFLRKDRPWTDTKGRSTFGKVPSYRGVDGKFHLTKPCDGPVKKNNTGEFCEYNYWDIYEYQGTRDDISLINDFNYDATKKAKINFRVFASRSKSKTNGFPTSVDPDDPGYGIKASVFEERNPNLKVAPSIDKDGLVPVKGRLLEDERSFTENDNLTLSASLGTTYEINNDLTLDVAVTDSRVTINTFWSDRYNNDLLRDAINNGDYDMFADTDKGDLDLYQTDAPMIQTSHTRSHDVILSGDAGLFGYAAGISYITESFEIDVAPQTEAQKTKNLGGGNGYGTREVNAAYAEVSVPFFDNKVEFDLAGRFDQYSDFGETFNPQLGVLYRPNNSLLFKTRYGTGFKAPSLGDINGEEARYYNNVFDYKNCNAARQSGNADDLEKYCEGNIGVETVGGGNKDLQPEQSRTYSFFAGYEPIAGTGLNLEYWNTIITDEISSPNNDEIMRLEAQGKDLPDGVIVERNVDGDVTKIVTPTTNLSSTLASGIDSKVFWGKKFSFGRLGVVSEYSYFLSLKTKPLEDSPYEETIGKNENNRWRWNNTFSYGLGKHNWALKSLSNAGYEKNDPSQGDVGSYTQWDASWTYQHPWNGTIQLGGRNIFNQSYSLDETGGVAQGGGGPIATKTGPTYFARYTQVL